MTLVQFPFTSKTTGPEIVQNNTYVTIYVCFFLENWKKSFPFHISKFENFLIMSREKKFFHTKQLLSSESEL